MKKELQQFADYLNLLYNATYMPMHLIQQDDILALYPSWAFPIQEFFAYKNAISLSDLTFDYISTPEHLYIGIVRNPDTDICVMLGPISLTPLSPKGLVDIIKTYDNNDASSAQIQEYFERTPSFSLHRFLSIMAIINTSLNYEVLDVTKKYATALDHVQRQVGKSHSDTLMERKENENYHDTFFFEQEYYGYVEKGDLEGLQNFLKTIPSFTEGSVAPDHIRQSKNIFITSITLATRHAIAGGLDIETAYQLSDSYIQEMEKMSDVSSINLLINSAIFDFTKRVADAKIPTDMSQEIFSCIQYISNHVNQNLSVEELAQMLHMERSTLSKKFKRELGFNISSFIMRRKLEEAKSLLAYSDKTISQISEYLCFSSQAYFQNSFKKQYGMTPRSYRQNHTVIAP